MPIAAIQSHANALSVDAASLSHPARQRAPDLAPSHLDGDTTDWYEEMQEREEVAMLRHRGRLVRAMFVGVGEVASWA